MSYKKNKSVMIIIIRALSPNKKMPKRKKCRPKEKKERLKEKTKIKGAMLLSFSTLVLQSSTMFFI